MVGGTQIVNFWEWDSHEIKAEIFLRKSIWFLLLHALSIALHVTLSNWYKVKYTARILKLRVKVEDGELDNKEECLIQNMYGKNHRIPLEDPSALKQGIHRSWHSTKKARETDGVAWITLLEPRGQA